MRSEEISSYFFVAAAQVSGGPLQQLDDFAVDVEVLGLGLDVEGCEAVEAGLRDDVLVDGLPDHLGHAEQDGDDQLLGSQGRQVEGLAAHLDEPDLHHEHGCHYRQEQVVVRQVAQHVGLVDLQHPGVEEVEHLQEHERAEEDGPVHPLLVGPLLPREGLRHPENVVPLEQQGQQDDDLPDSVEEDEADHSGCDDRLFAGVGQLLQQVLGGRLG